MYIYVCVYVMEKHWNTFHTWTYNWWCSPLLVFPLSRKLCSFSFAVGIMRARLFHHAYKLSEVNRWIRDWQTAIITGTINASIIHWPIRRYGCERYIDDGKPSHDLAFVWLGYHSRYEMRIALTDRLMQFNFYISIYLNKITLFWNFSAFLHTTMCVI